MKSINIGDLHLPVPIIQGGMGVGVSLSGLASAVANEGGVGVISSAGLGLVHRSPLFSFIEASIEGLRTEIIQAKEKSKGIIGVNILVAMSNFSDMVKTAIAEKVDIIFTGAGLPINLPSYLKTDSQTRLVPIVSSARAVKIICEKWMTNYQRLPDAFVVEGPKAGGHLGFKMSQIENPHFTLEELVPEVVKQVSFYEEKYGKEIPVIAAGGIYSGKDIYDIMQKGAKGVQMGTRFVTTEECDASQEFKQAYIHADRSDVKIIQSPVGMPGRAIYNDFLNKVSQGLKFPVKCPFHCIKTCEVAKSPYCIIAALYNAYKGKLDKGFVFAGSNAYIAQKVNTVKEVFNDLKDEFQLAVKEATLALENKK